MTQSTCDDSSGVGAPADRDAVREWMVARFTAWLDDVLSAEAPPSDIDAGILADADRPVATAAAPAEGVECDLYSLWSAQTAQTREISLQGREFKALREALAPMGPLADALGEVIASNKAALSASASAVEEVRAAAAAREEEASNAAGRETLNLLLGLRDRLVRGSETAEEHLQRADPPVRLGWLVKLLTKNAGPTARVEEATKALLEGYVLTLGRLDEALDDIGVAEIACLGRPFDPVRMKAVAVEQTDARPDGTVLEVYRRGYEWQGRVHRVAEVKVARGAAAAAES